MILIFSLAMIIGHYDAIILHYAIIAIGFYWIIITHITISQTAIVFSMIILFIIITPPLLCIRYFHIDFHYYIFAITPFSLLFIFIIFHAAITIIIILLSSPMVHITFIIAIITPLTLFSLADIISYCRHCHYHYWLLIFHYWY